MLAYLIGSIQLEHLGPLAGQGTAAMAALPVDEHPLLRETAGVARGVPAEKEFRRGLDVLLRGPARRAPAHGAEQHESTTLTLSRSNSMIHGRAGRCWRDDRHAP